MRRAPIRVILAALSVLVAVSASAGTVSVSKIEFSEDYRLVTIAYEKGSWTFHRPILLDVEFPVLGKVYWVATSGDDKNAGTAVSPFRTVNRAVSAARAGDIVYIKAGTYVGQVTISEWGTSGKPIVISAAPGDMGKVKITSSAADVIDDPHKAVITVNNGAQHVWINGLVIEGSRGRPESPADETYGANGISWGNGAGYGCRATNNVIYNNLHSGLKELGHGGTNILIAGNVIFENGTDYRDHGIYAAADKMEIMGNIIFNNYGYGIHSYREPKHQLITHNLLAGNGRAGLILAGSYNEVYHNVMVANYWGIAYYRAGSAYNIVKNNIFAFNERSDGRYDDGGGTVAGPHDNIDDYNCYYPTKPDPRIAGPNEVYQYPDFESALTGNLRLNSLSPLIDSGAYLNLSASGGPSFPIDGSRPDIGAFERDWSLDLTKGNSD